MLEAAQLVIWSRRRAFRREHTRQSSAQLSHQCLQTPLQIQQDQYWWSEEYDEAHDCLELFGLIPFELLGRRHNKVLDIVEHSTKHSPRTGRNDVACIHPTSGCTLEQAKNWSGAEVRLPKSSEGAWCKSQLDCT